MDYKKEVLAGRGPYLIDISDAFASRDRVDDLFIDEVHFNANGYREVAKIISQELKNRGAL